MSEPDERDYLVLFGPDGKQIEASWDDLLSIEGQSFDEALHRRIVGNRSGRYWLISNRLGFHAMLLEVTIFRCFPREPGHDEWQISYCSNGIANYPHWTLDGALRIFQDKGIGPDPWDNAPIPENVVELARQHVTSRAGRMPGPDPLDISSVRTRDAAEIRERLTEFLEGTVDPTELLRQVAGKRVAVFELLLALTMFCGQHDLNGKEDEIIGILLPADQHERFVELAEELANQFGSE